MKLIIAAILASILTGCSFHTAKGSGFTFLIEQTRTTKENGIEVTNVTKPDVRSIKVIGSTSAGIITGNMWAPAVVAGADSIGDGIGKAVDKTSDAVFTTQSQRRYQYIPMEPIPTSTTKTIIY